MKHLLAASIFGGVMFLIVTGADYLTNAAFGLALNMEFNFGLATGMAIGFWNWAEN